jgi:drug/metabolite transporter (DMT)-like permease
MPTSALALALAAACVHALWNVLLARSRDVEAATAVAVFVAWFAYLPVAIVLWRVHPSVWPYVLASGLLQLAYTALLAAAYRRAALSVVYPLARGLAPVLVLLGSVVVLGRGTSAGEAAGVCLVGVGVLLVRGGLRRPQGAGSLFGVTIACLIAGYTLVDKHGLAQAGAFPYLQLEMTLPSLVYPAALVRIRGTAALRAEIGWHSIVAGLATFGAYGLVLLALQRAAAAPVAAVRETSVVIAALLARRLLRETVGAGRLAGAAAVAGGIALLSLT